MILKLKREIEGLNIRLLEITPRHPGNVAPPLPKPFPKP